MIPANLMDETTALYDAIDKEVIRIFSLYLDFEIDDEGCNYDGGKSSKIIRRSVPTREYLAFSHRRSIGFQTLNPNLSSGKSRNNFGSSYLDYICAKLEISVIIIYPGFNTQGNLERIFSKTGDLIGFYSTNVGKNFPRVQLVLNSFQSDELRNLNWFETISQKTVDSSGDNNTGLLFKYEADKLVLEGGRAQIVTLDESLGLVRDFLDRNIEPPEVAYQRFVDATQQYRS